LSLANNCSEYVVPINSEVVATGFDADLIIFVTQESN